MTKVAPLSRAEYEQLILKSRLLSKDTLASAYQSCLDYLDAEKVSQPRFARWLENQGLLTAWQNLHLQEGRHKGFFLGRYKLLRFLGAGASSRVYLAEHPTLRRQVAIKLLTPRGQNASRQLRRFQRECEAIASLDHANIVRAYDFDSDSNRWFLVMEYVDGPDLNQVVKKRGPLPFLLAADCIRQAALGLQHAHENGIIHRDIKPSNLLLDRGTVKILDLGVARLLNHRDSSMTLEEGIQVIGTIDFLPPEQFLNSHEVDGRADLYSLGCTMYLLLTGKAPFAEGSQGQRIVQHQTIEPKHLREVRPQVPASLAAICHQLMAKRPEDRFQSAQEVAHHLKAWIKSEVEARRTGSVEGSEEAVELPTKREAILAPLADLTSPLLYARIDQATPNDQQTPKPKNQILLSGGNLETALDKQLISKEGSQQAILQQLMHDLLDTARSQEKGQMHHLINQLVLPQPATWFREVFGENQGGEAACEYIMRLPHLKTAFGRFIERVAQRKLNQIEARPLSAAAQDIELMGKLLEKIQSPVPFYSIRLQQNEKANGGVSLAAFALVDNQFRFLGPLKSVA
ncbi:Serine/threonine protein kinase [Planctomycetales bacterium 10988]|nr:Serine/threonine protein kinase [Planctomycetales bacterium 10988]